MRLRRVLVPTVAILGAFMTAGAQAGDPEAGRYTAQTCLGCHGIPGYENAYPHYNVPKLGGQNAEYIIDAMQAYRDGARDHAVMRAQASSLSDQDIEDIAAFFENAERR